MHFVRCKLDGCRCPACEEIDEYTATWYAGACPYGLYHDSNVTYPQPIADKTGVKITGKISDTCMFMGSYGYKPDKELRDKPLFSYNQILQLLKKEKHKNDG